MKLKLIAGFLLICALAVAQPKEELKYNLRYSIFRGGEATLKEIDTIYQGKKAVHFHLEGNTVGLADKLFSVHDIYESIVDPQTFLPYMAIRNVKEKNYRYYNKVYFFNENDSIYSTRNGGEKVPHNLVDFLTAFFYLRNNDYLDRLDVGEEFTIPVHHADDHFMMKCKYMGTETIHSGLGKVKCHVISPRVEKGKILKRSDGLKFYITQDKARIPLLLEFDMKVGALKCELDSYKKNGVEQIK
jgi:hypothetical protein